MRPYDGGQLLSRPRVPAIETAGPGCLTLIETDTRSTKTVVVAALVQQEHLRW